MKLAKSLLLGSAAALVATAGASAADLPSKKAAPVQYVKVCDAYGAGFFTIPGTDTCVKIGGRVRADYGMSGAKETYTITSNAKAIDKKASTQNTLGWEARGRIDFDARTPTAYGTVQTVASLRMARTAGTYNEARAPKGADGDAVTISARGAAVSLEAAYVRFAGFTFGAARDNFAFMPSLTYGAGHWGSFANGAKQLAYTAVLGGGLSATVAVQDWADIRSGSNFGYTASSSNPYYVYNNSSPQLNATLRYDQSWGSLQLSGAFASVTLASETVKGDTSVWAIGGGAKINLPMLAKGTALYLHGAYADGMLEYTTNWTGGKESDTKANVGGWAKATTGSFIMDTSTGAIHNVKSWVVAGLLEHYWTPQWRSVAWGSYGQHDAPAFTKGKAYNGTSAFEDQTVWNIGKNLAWLPTRNFELGVEIMYSRVDQKINLRDNATGANVLDAKDSNWTGRIRAERTF